MRLVDHALRSLARVVTPEEAHAHCDVPCGIYDPHQSQVAALTILRMNQLIRDLPKPDAHAPADEVEVHDAKLGRYIASKEEHAEMCKRELRILWGDYFNPTHLEQHPDVHTLFWNAMKLASRTRQEVDLAAAEQLLATTQQIAELFWETKGAQTQRVPTRHAVGGELVHPIP